MHGLDATRIPGRSRELLALLGLTESASARILEYSHGMKKKLALACALIHDPDVLFLDEPFEGLDALSARVVMENLRALARRGKTIFLTSHILEIVEKICDEAVILADGQVAHREVLAPLPGEEARSAGRLERIFFEIASGERDQPLLSWANRLE
jgi:ABC-2 type transport system ATP-binding protein